MHCTSLPHLTKWSSVSKSDTLRWAVCRYNHHVRKHITSPAHWNSQATKNTPKYYKHLTLPPPTLQHLLYTLDLSTYLSIHPHTQKLLHMALVHPGPAQPVGQVGQVPYHYLGLPYSFPDIYSLRTRVTRTASWVRVASTSHDTQSRGRELISAYRRRVHLLLLHGGEQGGSSLAPPPSVGLLRACHLPIQKPHLLNNMHQMSEIICRTHHTTT